MTDRDDTSLINARNALVVALVLLALVLFSILALNPLVSWLWMPGTIVDVISDGPGGPETCYRKDFEAVPNHIGDVAVVRAAYCPGHDPVALGYNFYVVFIHRAELPNSRRYVAIEYVPSDAPETGQKTNWYSAGEVPEWMDEFPPPPKLVWIRDSLLAVEIEARAEQVIVQKKWVDDVGVHCDFAAGEPLSREAQLRGAFEIK